MSELFEAMDAEAEEWVSGWSVRGMVQHCIVFVWVFFATAAGGELVGDIVGEERLHWMSLWQVPPRCRVRM